MQNASGDLGSRGTPISSVSKELYSLLCASSAQRSEFLVWLGLFLMASIVIVIFNLTIASAAFLTFGAPTLYLSIRRPSILMVTLLPAMLFGTLWFFSAGFVAELGGAWIWPREEAFLIPYYIAGVVPADGILWAVLWAWHMFSFFVFFFTCIPALNKRIVYAVGIGIAATLSILLIQKVNVQLLHFEYAYLVFGLLLSVPAIAALSIKGSKNIYKYIAAGLVLSLLYVICEVVGLTQGHWLFTGQYVYAFTVHFFLLPLEEIVFWIMLGAPLGLFYYDYFCNPSFEFKSK